MTAPSTPPSSPSSPSPPAGGTPAPPAGRTRRIITVPPRQPRTNARVPPHIDAATGPRAFRLLGTDDLSWIADLTDAVAALAGEPWRVALEMIEGGTWLRTPDRSDDGNHADAPRSSPQPQPRSAPQPIPPRRLHAATAALRRLLAGRPDDANLARNARALLLGAPALDDAARASRIASVAAQLAITPATLERVLWADVPRERPIDLTRGRPTPTEVAALANVGLLQRALARAHSLEIVIRGDAGPLLRGCAARGLIVTASERQATHATAEPAVAPARETVLDVTGPLALCHSTAVYGRALGSLVPLLATCESFALTIRAEAHGQRYELRVDSPALLPPAAAPRRWALVERLATDLERAGALHGVRVRRAPPALAQRIAVGDRLAGAPGGGALACPDLGIEIADRLIWIDVVGFWTPEYLARKLARYRAVGARDVLLCIDSSRACDDDDPPSGACVVRFERRIHAAPLLDLLGVATVSRCDESGCDESGCDESGMR